MVTGNADSAHRVINEMTEVLLTSGFTVSGQACTCWNKELGAGESYVETESKHDWSRRTVFLLLW